ncbi:sce7726 family protein [Xanthobacter versatilis]|uniref:sce7726 family protein n=1 Tax=Xanthobacter autotrophicus (strain ATCC BAA-1158 / Py2) TaxID=78245 RepID=UPI00372AD814
MRDRDVRESVWRWLEFAHAGDPDTLMLDELGILNGATRIDIAVINGQMEGFELKSERDTLERLPAQRDLYNKVFDRISIVVAENHREAAEDIVPDWWGLAVASSTQGGVQVTYERQPEANPGLDAATVASLLWRDEALAILERYGAARGVRSKPREALYDRLAVVLDLDTVRAEVRSALKVRAGWRVDRRVQRCGDSHLS